MSVRVITMNGELKYQGDVGPQGPVGPRGEQGVQGIQGIDGVSPVVEVSKNGKTTTISITDEFGTHTAQINDGEVSKEELDNALNEAKSYTDTEIATFDFIKVVNSLPQEGLPNKIYLVPKTDTQTQDLFDEFVWANNAWEWITTKQVEIDLTDYATKEELALKVDKVQGKSLSTNDYDNTEKQNNASNTTARHTHSNKTILDNTTASYTEEEKNKLAGLNNYTLPTASADTLGGVKVGAGLSITNGVLSATGGGVADSVEWENVQNKPSTYPPSAHTHTKSEITDFPAIPTKTSDLTNDSGFMTSYTETDPTVPSWAKQPSKPSYTPAEVGALAENGNGSTVTVTFIEASKREDITTGETLSGLFGKIAKFLGDLRTVAFTGSFSSLHDKPTIATQTVVTNFWKGTQAEYDALTTKSDTTLYLITEESSSGGVPEKEV